MRHFQHHGLAARLKFQLSRQIV